MKLRHFLASLPLLLLSGCVVHGHSSNPGDVTVLWSFGGTPGNGLGCLAAGVTSVVITIPGQTLANNGRFDCTTQGTDGIVLQGFEPGNYSYTVDGFDANQVDVYQASSSFTVDGNVQLAVQLAPLANAPNSYLTLHWNFAGAISGTAPLCRTDFDRVDLVDVDANAAVSVYSCADGAPGATGTVYSPGFVPGNHHFYLRAYYSGQTSVIFAQSSVAAIPTTAGGVTDVTFNLGWLVGGGSLGWQIHSGSGAVTCASAGITSATLNFGIVGTTTTVYGPAGDPGYPGCDANGVNGSARAFLPPGQYDALVTAHAPSKDYAQPNGTSFPFDVAAAGHFDLVGPLVPLY